MSLVYKYLHDYTDNPAGTTRKGLWIEDYIDGAGLTSSTDWYSTFVDQGNDGGYPTNDGGALIVPFDTDGQGIEPRSYTWSPVNQFSTLSTIDNRYYKRNAARGEWFTVVSGLYKVAMPFPNTTVYSKEVATGNTAVVTSNGNYPTSSSIYCNQDFTYYGDKPICIFAQGNNYAVIPVNLKSNMFASYSSRYGSTIANMFNPGSQTVEVDIFEGGAGIGGVPINTVILNSGERLYETLPSDNTWYYFLARGGDICMSAVESTGGDGLIMTPACDTIYTRRSGNDTNMLGSGPSVQGTYHNQDANRCVSVEIADGAGGDACQHVGLENLSNTYAFGMQLSDYHITSPFDNTIEVYYCAVNSLSNWSLLNTHILTGSLLSPGEIGVDGNGGSFEDSGQAAYLASGAVMWMFKGTKPFQITVNDTSDDEEPLFGWMENEDNTMFANESDLLGYVDTVNDYYRIDFPI